MTIPKIIHQSWKTENIPDNSIQLVESWKKYNPDWEYKFWTDEDNRKFIAENYNWFLPTYDAYNTGIKKANATRYFIMHFYGGVYADLDFECLKPLDPYLLDAQLALSTEPTSHLDHETEKRKIDKIVSDAFMASTPKHPFWEYLFQFLTQNKGHKSPLDAVSVYQSFSQKELITLLKSELVFPVTKWQAWEVNLDPVAIRVQSGSEAFAVHHWHGTWWRTQILSNVRDRIKLRRGILSSQNKT